MLRISIVFERFLSTKGEVPKKEKFLFYLWMHLDGNLEKTLILFKGQTRIGKDLRQFWVLKCVRSFNNSGKSLANMVIGIHFIMIEIHVHING